MFNIIKISFFSLLILYCLLVDNNIYIWAFFVIYFYITLTIKIATKKQQKNNQQKYDYKVVNGRYKKIEKVQY